MNKIFLTGAACLLCCACFTTMKTAKITPIGTNSHTLAVSAFTTGPTIESAGSIYYCFRRGITDRLEIGFDADLLPGSLGVGAKYKIAKSIAIDANLRMSYFQFVNYNVTRRIVPNGDFSLIFGENTLYGGVKYVAITDISQFSLDEGVIFPFIGYAIPIGTKFKLVPEFAFSLLTTNYDGHKGTFLVFNPVQAGFGILFGVGISF
jgi:hypothetical protein